MNNPSDEEVNNRYKAMSNAFLLCTPVFPEFKITNATTSAMTFRDYLFYQLLNALNKERAMIKLKPLTVSRLAIALNKHPTLKVNKEDNNEELYTLIDKCEKAGNYKLANWILFPKKK